MATKQEPATEIPSLTVQLDSKQLANFQASAPKILEQARELEVITPDDYEASAAFLDLVTKRQQKIVEFFDKPTKEANSVHKFLTSLRTTLTMPYTQAEDLIKKRRKDYRDIQERKRQAKEEEDRKKAKADEEARALQEAKELAELGEHEAANVVIERAVAAPPPPVIVPSIVPKQAGHSIRKVWRFRVKNPDLIKRDFLVPKNAYDPAEYPKIRDLVDGLGPDAAQIVGGIEIYQDELESSRRR